MLGVLGPASLVAQRAVADEAWVQRRYEAARVSYQQVLAQDPGDIQANLRIGTLLSWQGKLDSSLIFLDRARAADPSHLEIRLTQARVLAWNKKYAAALARYDSLLIEYPELREAALGRARTLAWLGRLDAARSVYRQILAADSTDHEALAGAAQVSAWSGELGLAEEEYRKVLNRNPRDLEAQVGLGYVYLWRGREALAGRQAQQALAIDSTHTAGRELRRAVREATRPSVESSANWSNDSDDNTSFGQTLSATAPMGEGIGLTGTINALETSDRLREATRVGAEAGFSVRSGDVRVSGGAGARRLYPDVAAPRTSATYHAGLSFRPIPRLGLSVGYSRSPFDEIAGLIERGLDIELLEGGADIRASSSLTVHGGAGALWVSDGNSRTSFIGSVNQKLGRQFLVGLLGRTLSYEQRGTGYFSPDRFSVLEGVAGFTHESRAWVANLSGGLGAQKVGEQGATQAEWHVEGRVGPRWGTGNRVELFGLITNSAVSSTTGAFRYRAAGLSVRLGL
jgi:tetratricopeptide (TPR) repeat protein